MFREHNRKPQISRGTRPLSILAGSWCLLVVVERSVLPGVGKLETVRSSECTHQKGGSLKPRDTH